MYQFRLADWTRRQRQMPGHWRLQRPGQQLGAGLRVLIALTHRRDRQQWLHRVDRWIFHPHTWPLGSEAVGYGPDPRDSRHSQRCRLGSRCGFFVVRPPAPHSQLRFLSREGDSCYHQQVQLRPGQQGLVQESSGNRRDKRRRCWPRIISSILEAAREAIPMTGGGLSRSNNNLWWNKECEEAVRLKRVMYRHYSKDQNAETHERMKAANRDCNKIIAQAKKDHWIAFADSISAGKADLGSVWKKIRRMKQQCVVPDSDL